MQISVLAVAVLESDRYRIARNMPNVTIYHNPH